MSFSGQVPGGFISVAPRLTPKFETVDYVCNLLSEKNIGNNIIGELAMMWYHTKIYEGSVDWTRRVSRALSKLFSIPANHYQAVEIAVLEPEMAVRALENGTRHVARKLDRDTKSFCYSCNSGTGGPELDGAIKLCILPDGQYFTFLPKDRYFTTIPLEFNTKEIRGSPWTSDYVKDWVGDEYTGPREGRPHIPLLAKLFLSLTYRAANLGDAKAHAAAWCLARDMKLSLAWLHRAVMIQSGWYGDRDDLRIMEQHAKHILHAQGQETMRLTGQPLMTDKWMSPMNRIPGCGWFVYTGAEAATESEARTE